LYDPAAGVGVKAGGGGAASHEGRVGPSQRLDHRSAAPRP